MAATGGAVAFLGARPETLKKESHARSSVLLNCSPEKAYQFWRNFENLPRFMNHLDSVSVLGDRRSRWTALGPMGRRITWEAEIDNERENEFISWHSLPESDINASGYVCFRPAPAGRGTLLEASLDFASPGGVIGSGAAKIMGKDPGFLMRQDLRRLKALIEAGEIPTVEGQTHGPRSAMTAIARMANPDRPIRSGAPFADVFEAQRRIS